ncbi:cobalamin B12-binding domain-containing protein [Rhodovulum sulfidophilum]|uniref:cobalamin B12-binding domain-containing protein n=1 Tax=Rhodovulum sulfidophilum TaxID=35806 RepID=UPI001389BBD8|nr:cobalamin B12-binding domain-containing protein [Rhodovulum sulfidophilum]NDK35618.1 cobalamin B12-binding domain-containing protein [Rhodovulum sulfidophilum]
MDSDQRQPAEAFPVPIGDVISRPLPEANLRRVAQEALMRVARLPGRRAPLPEPPAPAEIEALCTALATGSLEQARRIVDDHLARGRDKTWIAEGLLPEAARLMGRRWESDEVSFIEVGQAVGRLQRLLRLLRAEAGPRRPDPVRRAIFATPETETHTFGVIVAADAFRERGWEIDLSLSEPPDRLLADLTRSQVPLLGLSVSSRRSAPPLMQLLADLRTALPRLRVLLCGTILSTSPEAARQIPVDDRAADLPSAFEAADRLLLESLA